MPNSIKPNPYPVQQVATVTLENRLRVELTPCLHPPHHSLTFRPGSDDGALTLHLSDDFSEGYLRGGDDLRAVEIVLNPLEIQALVALLQTVAPESKEVSP